MIKHITVFIIVFIVFISCNRKNSKSQSATDNISVIKRDVSIKKRSSFFNFDEIIHYNLTDKMKDEFSRIRQSENKTEEEGRFHKLYTGHYPQGLNEKYFFQDLAKYYVQKKDINKKYFSEIDSIYSEKYYGEYVIAGCIPFYNDILIFKKNNNVVGISKICFQCNLQETLGTKLNTEQLGQNGDYEKLQNILKKNSQ